MKEEKTIEQALKDAAEQAGAKPEEMKTVAVEQVAGIHVFSSDMEKPPDMIVTGGLPSNYLGSALAVPPQNTNDKTGKKKGEKSNGKNEPEI